LTDPHLWFAFSVGVFVTLARRHVTFSEVYAGGIIARPASAWFAGRLKETGLAGG
jgi:hypothetical protein